MHRFTNYSHDAVLLGLPRAEEGGGLVCSVPLAMDSSIDAFIGILTLVNHQFLNTSRILISIHRVFGLWLDFKRTGLKVT